MAIVDWDLAASTAARLGPTGPQVSLEEAVAVVADLRVLADQAATHVAAYTGLDPVLADAGVRVVDRSTWAEANVAGLRNVIKPLQDKGNIVGAKLNGVQAGALLAYLSGKVLGQYEVFDQDSGQAVPRGGYSPPRRGTAAQHYGQLLLVAPNILAIERKLGVVPHDFRLWVCMHELTHRTQFTAVPWLREHFLGEVRAYVEASSTSTDFWRTAGKMVEAARSRTMSLVDAMQTPEQKAILDRLTAILTLLEGHAEFVMDGVGPEVIATVAQIRATFERRRAAANPVEQYVRRLFGVDIKLRQYAEGRRFVSAVVDRVGMSSFNKVFDSPGTLPVLAELSDPDAWVARVAP